MQRREFVATCAGGVGWAALPGGLGATTEAPAPGPNASRGPWDAQSIRSLFPRLESEVYLNGGGGAPLARFAEDGIRRYLDFARLGPAEGRGDYVGEVVSGAPRRFAELIGARESEIGFVECTKAGEQIVLDGLEKLRAGGNVVTNDLHFSRSLHNLVGLRRAGRDVRIVRSQNFDVPLERMAGAIDEDTALVTVSLVSNVNGRIEPIRELADLAHARGALLFADIIQAAGTIPIDVKAMGIDVAACSSYKWLLGIHGAGFLYVSDEVQGAALPDSLFPGQARRNYPPFVAESDASGNAFTYTQPSNAARYQPGHVSYLGYAAAYEGLGFIAEVGVQRIQAHAALLNRRLLDQIDPDRYKVLSTHVDESPILSLEVRDPDALLERLMASEVVVSMGGDKWNQTRISPAIYNDEADMDRLAEVLNA